MWQRETCLIHLPTIKTPSHIIVILSPINMQCDAFLTKDSTSSLASVKAVFSRTDADTVASKLVVQIVGFLRQLFAGRPVLLNSWYAIILPPKDYQDLIHGLKQDRALWGVRRLQTKVHIN